MGRRLSWTNCGGRMNTRPRTESAVGVSQALLAVVLFSASPVLIRWAPGVSAIEVTFWRLVLATLTVLGLGAITRRMVDVRALPHRRFAAYGVVIALHFFLYIAS